jgi:hypothetical protein
MGGCTSNRSDLTPEEALLDNGENTLLYAGKYSSHAFKIHLACSSGTAAWTATEEQWSNIAVNLKLAISSPEAGPKITGFYAEFKVGEFYNIKKLILLSLLLTRGTAKEKAKILFDVCDDSKLQAVKKAHIIFALEELFDIAIEKLPKLKLENDPNKVTTQDLENFLERARIGKQDGLDEVVKGIIGDEEVAELSHFEAFFSANDNILWLESRGLRENLRKKGKEVQKKLRKKTKENNKEPEVPHHNDEPISNS